MNNTLTKENLEAIFEAMQKIKAIDQSDYFKKYYLEVLQRLQEIEGMNPRPKFIIFERNGKQFIEHTIYPKFIAGIENSEIGSQIETSQSVLDHIEINKAIKEANEYISQVNSLPS